MFEKYKDRKQTYMHIATGTFFFVMVIVLFTYLFYGQNHFAPERAFKLSTYEYVYDDWILTRADGTTMTYSITEGSPVMAYGETVTISHILPSNPLYDSLMIWSYGQDMDFYVDDELRCQYSRDNVYGIGPDRPYLYIRCPLFPEDGGKQITIRITASEVSSGYKIGPIRVGSEAALLIEIIKGPQFELIMSGFLILLGIIVILASVFLQFTTKRSIPLKFLGSGVILASTWLLLNSTGRQFVFGNISTVRNCAFFVVALMPIPFAFFFDELTDKRHHIAFAGIEHVCLLDFMVLFIFNITGFKGPSEIFEFTYLTVFALVFLILFFSIKDALTGHKSEFRLSSLGALFFGACGIMQIIIYHFVLSERANGIFLSIGLLIMTLLSLFENVRKLSDIRISETNALQQVETLSREALITISRTVDAKDPYTSEHSYRVSEYAGLLAQKLGWPEEEVSKLREAGLLHDIGKIGIPDSVLNKNGRLTDEEFGIIKSHTTMGAEILKDISTMEYATIVAKHHHERYDGHGYPDGLAGKDIPAPARLVCIVDSYDAMHSKRCYRDAIDKGLIREELLRCRGTQFDPEMLDAFIELMDANTV